MGSLSRWGWLCCEYRPFRPLSGCQRLTGCMCSAGITSLLKIYAIYQMIQPHATPERVVTVMILGTAEGAITIMAVSIPALSAFLKKPEHEPQDWPDMSLKSLDA